MSVTVGTYEARNNLSALLDRVERGESVTITRNGKPIAELRSPQQVHDRAKAQAAAKRMLERRAKIPMPKRGDPTIREMREEGRM
ncbi:MAG: type II toxin-antitoxin system prevent-host-death family antitoxin [Pseudomonadota bacterium]